MFAPHRVPLYPVPKQLQVYELALLMHAPPLRHGFDAHHFGVDVLVVVLVEVDVDVDVVVVEELVEVVLVEVVEVVEVVVEGTHAP